MDKYVCIHGHFYQPPRENPWLEEIELQDSAYPYHDWNERISVECYGPNARARILGEGLVVIDIINNYSKISFNFGPTLLSDLEKRRPDVYRSVIEADRLSMANFSGHGSAIAQVYNHMIMPLANKRDKETQVRWGIEDFRKRFGRDPEGMWLPETAVDPETLDILVSHGIKFTVLAPRQAKRTKKPAKGARWKESEVDTRLPYLVELPSGKNIAVFFYDGEIAHEVSFGGLLYNGEAFARRMTSPAHQDGTPYCVSIATDGETFGHHHKYGEMALAYCLHSIESNKLASLTNFGAFLEKHPPEHLAEVHENSSWSCAHGVERWRDDCGCNSGTRGGWNQQWRKPLREALDWLRDSLSPVYEEEGAKYLKDPWGARDAYIGVILDRSRESVDAFFGSHASRELSEPERIEAIKLLEMQRNALLMYTSCGWFFDEVSGIETVQVMQYAARAIQLAEEARGVALENEFMKRLESAPSNVYANGRSAYEMFAANARIDLERVGMHYAISSLFDEYGKSAPIYCYDTESDIYEKYEAGKLKLAMGITGVRSRVTNESARFFYSVLHLGDNSVNGGISPFAGISLFNAMKLQMTGAFEKRDIPEIIRLMDKYFGTNSYSLRHLFRDEQRKIIDQILSQTYGEIEASYRHIFDDNYNMMEFLRQLNIPLPEPLSVTASFTINTDLKRSLTDGVDIEKVKALIRKAAGLSVRIDSEMAAFKAGRFVNASMERLSSSTEDIPLMETTRDLLEILRPMDLPMDLLSAQDAYFRIGKGCAPAMKERSAKGDDAASKWLAVFNELGDKLRVKVRI
ncbi:MAG: DUF3536 domain-containing protein [Deltaproteobacteria bacterium]|nr:DUF3536 domain-containing protein [Deltaproteobacteria bacterium]